MEDEVEPLDNYSTWQKEELNKIRNRENRGKDKKDPNSGYDTRIPQGPMQDRYQVEQKETLDYYPKDRKDKRPIQGPIQYVTYENPMHGKTDKVEYAGQYKRRRTPVQTQKLEFGFGSDKLDKSICTFNPGGSAHDCPSKRKGDCPISDKCYAINYETQYFKASPARSARMKYQFENVPAERFIEEINKHATKKRGVKVKYSRFSVAGDIEHQWQVDKLSDIGKGVKKSGVGLYGYSKAKDLDWDKLSSNVRLNVGNARPPKGHSGFVMMPEAKFESLVKKNIRGGKKPDRFNVCIAGVHSCGPSDVGRCHKCMPDTKAGMTYGYARERGKKHDYYAKRWSNLMKGMNIKPEKWSKW